MNMDERRQQLIDKTIDMIKSILQHNELDTSFMTDDASWYVGSAAQNLKIDEIPAYLSSNAIDYPAQPPQVVLAHADSMGNECISVTGEMEYPCGDSNENGELIVKVSFNADWILCDSEEWKLKKFISISRKTDNINEWNKEIRIDKEALTGTLPVGVVCCENVDRLPVQVMNQHILRMLGYSSISDYKRMVGESVYSSVHPDDLQAFDAFIQTIEKEGHSDSKAFRFRKKDFSYLWMHFFGAIAEDKWIVFACVDHSEQKEAVDALISKSTEDSEQIGDYKKMIDYMPGGFHRCTLFDPIHVEYMSENLCQMSGYSQREIKEELNSIYTGLVDPRDHMALGKMVMSLMEYPHTEQIEYRMKKKDGSIEWVTETSRSIRESDGKMWAYAVVTPSLKTHDDENEIDSVKTLSSGKKVEIKTFGYFEIYVDDKPIHFRSQKAREMLAFLVDRRGGFATQSSIINALWENETANKTTLARCRKTYKTLLDELKEYEIEEIVESNNGARRVIPENINCDIINYCSGKTKYKNLFKGAYMTEYSWAEFTLSELLHDMQ